MMKNEKKTLLLTSLVCLIPMVVGALVYSRLPETMATHFGLDGTPDGWSSRLLPCSACRASSWW